MPELPEVEYGRRVAELVSLNRVITRVWCARDSIVFQDPPARVRRGLTGRRVNAVRRHGKYLWFELDARPWPVFHFGMTGSFRVPGGTSLRLESSPSHEPDQWPPRFAKIRLYFDDGGELVMTNARRLGRIRLRNDPPTQPPIGALGFDPLLALPPLREFRRLLAKRSTRLKALLLDQRFAAGVGNWIADEVLYQARIDPRRRVNELSSEEVARIHRKLAAVIRTAVRVNADKAKFPASWLFHRRWGRRPDATTTRGEPIRHIVIAGRSTAWVPSVQT